MATSTDRKLSETTQIQVLTGQENIPFFKGLMNGFFPLSLIKTFITKKDVGLEFADNTADLNKPISIPQQEALDNKADRTHNHSSQDITDFTTAVNTIVNPKLDLKSDKGHTHLSEDVTDLTETINNNVDPKLLGKADKDHTHPDMGGSIDLPADGLLKVGEAADTIAKAIPSIDYINKDNIAFFTKPQVPSVKIINSITETYSDAIVSGSSIDINWDILQQQVLYVGVDNNFDNILITHTGKESIPDQTDLTITEGEDAGMDNWRKFIGTQYQLILHVGHYSLLGNFVWGPNFLWPNGSEYYPGTNILERSTLIMNFELVGIPSLGTIEIDDGEGGTQPLPSFNLDTVLTPYLAFLGVVENLIPSGPSTPPPDGGGEEPIA